MTKYLLYLGLGSNLGHREQNIQKAIELIDEKVGKVLRQSTLIATEPWGFRSEYQFLNGVICCETTKTPREVLQLTQQIERDMGREKKTGGIDKAHRQYADRIIDIDILLYDDMVIDEPDLKVPHPLMQQRDFVMIPLNEIKETQ